MNQLQQAIQELLQTTSSGSQMVAKHGTDWTKWPKGHWLNALTLIQAAEPHLAAAFTWKETA